MQSVEDKRGPRDDNDERLFKGPSFKVARPVLINASLQRPLKLAPGVGRRGNIPPALHASCSACCNSHSQSANQIVFCHNCQHGFHQQCHQPNIRDCDFVAATNGGGEKKTLNWLCRFCVFTLHTTEGGAELDSPTGAVLKRMKQKLHYDISALTWDSSHKMNSQETYCYCGGSGHWNLKMIQCYKCAQWFHESCLQCLSNPILNGDRFFIFACAVCNKGNEYIKRMPLRWVDAVHLVLYNITLVKKIKYFDVNETIVPYFNQHWDSLRLGELAYEASTRQQLRDRVRETLQTNSSQFQCGAESKKSKSAFRLRLRCAPEPPIVNIPQCDVIDDKLVESLNLRHGSALITLAPTPPPPPLNNSSDQHNSATPPPSDKHAGKHRSSNGNGPMKRKRPSFVKALLYDETTEEEDDDDDDDEDDDSLDDSSNEAPSSAKRGRGRPPVRVGKRRRRIRSSNNTTASNNKPTRRPMLPAPPKPPSAVTKRRHHKPLTSSSRRSTTTSSSGEVARIAAANSHLISPRLLHRSSHPPPPPVVVDHVMMTSPPGSRDVTGGSKGGDDVAGGDLISQIPKPREEGYKRMMASYYGGAAGRLAAGERYIVHAKRVVSSRDASATSGKEEMRTEYLIEWLGFTAHQLHQCQSRH